jgi:hypothetical protein
MAENNVYTLHYGGEKYRVGEDDVVKFTGWDGSHTIVTVTLNEESEATFALSPGVPFVLVRRVKGDRKGVIL